MEFTPEQAEQIRTVVQTRVGCPYTVLISPDTPDLLELRQKGVGPEWIPGENFLAIQAEAEKITGTKLKLLERLGGYPRVLTLQPDEEPDAE